MQQVQVNKWVRLILTLLAGSGGLLALLAAYNWTTVTDVKTAGIITLVFSSIKAIIDLIAPSAGVTTTPVSGASASLITHRSIDTYGRGGSAT